MSVEKHRNNFLKKAKEIHGDKYDYSKMVYVNTRTKVKIICPVHGEFEQAVEFHLRGLGCRKCFDERKRAENSGEYQLPGTRFKLDGYCEETKTIYEFHGCVFHGCPKCCKTEDICPVNKINNKVLYEKT